MRAWMRLGGEWRGTGTDSADNGEGPAALPRYGRRRFNGAREHWHPCCRWRNGTSKKAARPSFDSQLVTERQLTAAPTERPRRIEVQCAQQRGPQRGGRYEHPLRKTTNTCAELVAEWTQVDTAGAEDVVDNLELTLHGWLGRFWLLPCVCIFCELGCRRHLRG